MVSQATEICVKILSTFVLLFMKSTQFLFWVNLARCTVRGIWQPRNTLGEQTEISS